MQREREREKVVRAKKDPSVSELENERFGC